MRVSGFPSIHLLLVVILVSLATSSLAQDQDHLSFIQCLKLYSDSLFPISTNLYNPEDASYSSVLSASIRNLRFNESYTPKPHLIITATHESHVQAAILCGKSHGVEMRIRSGGHDHEGSSYVSLVPFFVLDLLNFRSIDMNIDKETAWVQSGATVGELYYAIANKSKVHGFPAGMCPTIGVGGHFSGGGFGNMMRKYGLSVDNIIDAKLVDAQGRILERESMGEDLFWAITGGGAASFGVVLAYKIKLVPVPQNVTVFQVEKTGEDNITESVHRWLEIADGFDRDVFFNMILNVANRGVENKNKTIRATFMGFFLGDSEKLITLMNETFPELELQNQDCHQVSWIESVVYWGNFSINNGTSTAVLLNRTPPELYHSKMKSDYLQRSIPKEGLKLIFKKMVELEAPYMFFYPYGGKMSEISPDEKPFPHRAGNIANIMYGTDWTEHGFEAEYYYSGLTRKLYDFMTPFVSKFPRQAYLNFKDFDLGINHHGKNSYLQGKGYGDKYFKENYDRLVEIKSRVDPENYFKNEQSIPVRPLQEEGKLQKGISVI
ncbi:berberine bridge enzyme-like 8 [Nicotiana tabacum]|uniref:Berberine bridge enzyme-like 8 n=1 Tax=Nicotiana tabacum TaxID=4097 RepID=A0A1S3XA11_TOBAC|nr:berberine bridge enzyme-like 8 [Nicotiana tomentosiformis]XP_016436747.1 PREDICTED: reticuline oxidase-like protein [Nicotiana tabacum]